MKERLAAGIFVVSGFLLAYAAGFVTSLNDWPPSGTVKTAYGETVNLAMNWRNDLGFEPRRLLVPAEKPDRPRLAVAEDAALAPGYRLISGLTPDKESRFGVYLLDEKGAEVHFWPIRYHDLSEGSTSERNVFQHGTAPLPDGSIVVNFDNGDTIARVGPCGDTIWTASGNFHHGVHLSYDGTLWSWENEPTDSANTANAYPVDPEFIVQLDAETGERLKRISLLDDVIGRHRQHGVFAIRSEPAEDRINYGADPFHPNDVEVLTPAMAPAFPMFAAGDLLISLRSLNMVAVLDSDSFEVKWSQIGPWHRQHDPDFLPDGRISVFNNNMGQGASRIDVVDPRTGEISVAFDGAAAGDFYTWQRGRHQMLAGGGIMIAETERGRAFEVDSNGRVVWQFENIFDETRNGLVNEALIVDRDFFDRSAFRRCRPAF